MDLGWYAHQLFKFGGKKLNSGEFEVRLWEKPEKIPEFPIDEPSQKQLPQRLRFSLYYDEKESEEEDKEKGDEKDKKGKGKIIKIKKKKKGGDGNPGG